MASNCPAEVGMPLEAVLTPCLLVDLDALERNMDRMAVFARENQIRLRPHAKTHKCPAIALQQIARGAVGICCQKVSEAEAMVEGGVTDIMVSNQVVDPRMIERLARLARAARVAVCVDDAANIDVIAAATKAQDAVLDVLVEIDVGAGRCGVAPGRPAVELARRISASPALRFAGLQAYNGRTQHRRDHAERQALVDTAVAMTRQTMDLLESEGLQCPIIAGAGTGSYALDAASGLYNELQCGSYVFMDADYNSLRDHDGQPRQDFSQSLFLYTTVMSKTRPTHAVCDAGLKVQSVDSGLPVVHGRDDVQYIEANDEHGLLADPHNLLRLGERLRLVPGHCDPTVNLHDWLVGIRGGRVECIWPVGARGMSL
ncbi:3-hydroxy-D-aspartate aldolase [Natronocella acetinitrilica]|uniref:3-hydroxy-D-aspartate aldolase n=1 Tax=Natronocella acetinitrilica TaxID=414046 RepID=A0AAE3G444_9GAMM|nr:DSD1 family PLP-dependent enzyme [Natronocella acetinitrilica]MCP1673557.1 3-hydroxy-D-aspartate aldolase [Natronocella acetinitrilica]